MGVCSCVGVRVINPLKHAFFLVFNGFDIQYSRVFGVADYWSELRIKKFKMANPVWRKKFKKLLDSDNIWYAGMFGVADYKSELKNQKFKMAGSVWRMKIQIFTWLGRYLVLDGFWGRWIRTWAQNSEIQYGGLKLQKVTWSGWNLVLEVFGVADYKFELNIQKWKMSDAIWRTKMQKAKSYAAKVSLSHKFFRVADYEFDLRFLKSIFRISIYENVYGYISQLFLLTV